MYPSFLHSPPNEHFHGIVPANRYNLTVSEKPIFWQKVQKMTARKVNYLYTFGVWKSKHITTNQIHYDFLLCINGQGILVGN
jgi:hypothetical protein